MAPLIGITLRDYGGGRRRRQASGGRFVKDVAEQMALVLPRTVDAQLVAQVRRVAAAVGLAGIAASAAAAGRTRRTGRGQAVLAIGQILHDAEAKFQRKK